MFNILFKYFSLHKKLSLPGVGCFEIKEEPAFFNAENNLLHPPVQNIIFNADHGVADKHLFQFIAAANSIDEVEAIRLVHDFTYQLKEDVKSSDKAMLPYIGVLKNTSAGFTFEDGFALEYYPAIQIKEIIRQDINQPDVIAEEEEILDAPGSIDEEKSITKDWWWLYAIVLGVIAIAAIIYYHYFMDVNY